MFTGVPEEDRSSIGWLSQPQMRYPNEYVWFLLFSSMDIMLTWVILAIGGSEVNPLAEFVITAWGLPGAIAFKFSLMLMVVLVCEIVGRLRDAFARRLAHLAVIISALPVFYSILLLGVHILRIAD